MNAAKLSASLEVESESACRRAGFCDYRLSVFLWHILLFKEVHFLELEASATHPARRTQFPSDEQPGNSWHTLNVFDRLQLALPQCEAR